ncbi:hypothetical protein BT96DRAFT_1035611 [Gymnopus androsaceus JB14]|uniref:Uncharacterized protein n=1 Tax=Gymnopus androsaceus JB14 TaxID=1447944 RepID=A0A6A4HJI5_9AGAR|nr:hypothetical protein BT96DRAFT_1035611 [Gymnopus androsaceus JB14]
MALESQIASLTSVNKSLLSANQTLEAENTDLSVSLAASKANQGRTLKDLRSIEVDLKKEKKKVSRVKQEKKKMMEAAEEKEKKIVEEAEEEIEKLKIDIASLALENHDLHSTSSLSTFHLEKSDIHLTSSLETIHELRQRGYAYEKQVKRLKVSLDDTRAKLAHISTWNATKGGIYTPEARRLYRQLRKAGCRNFELAVRSCAEVFGIQVSRFMSRRTGGRCIKEGGIYGLMQLGREIAAVPAFGESTDGTTIRGITQECRHINLAVPSYAPGVDDSDPSTWTPTIRFAETAPALDHTAKRQFEGSMELGAKIAKTYSESPLAKRDGKTMDADDYFRKQVSQNMDHASDGKKKFNFTREKKLEVVYSDLGREAIDNMTKDEFLQARATITEADILKAAGITAHSLTTAKREEITLELLEQRVGEDFFATLPEAEARLLKLFLFVGCGSHKSLNAFRYGVVEMRETWKREGLQGPCDLGNKSQDIAMQIAADNSDSDALARCVESCPRGGAKLCDLAGALFRHKNHETGYQDRHRIFMEDRKHERYDIPCSEASRKFADVSNTRYQSHSYASAELLVFRDDYQDLVEEICDGKTKRGTNHLESNVLKGLQDPATLTELAAMALEGLCLSWPYMGMIRSPHENNFVDALSPEMIELHRRILPFTENIALHPEILLDPQTPRDQLTIDGEPFLDQTIIPTLRALSNDLPYLNLMISAIFRGSAYGWSRFTPEYKDDPNDPQCIASLTPAERERLGPIPMTNDSNEGGLGSLKNFLDSSPSSDAFVFSAHARVQRNNTEAFAAKHCDDDDQLFVMRLARVEDASGEMKRFRDEYSRLQKERAEAALLKEAENKRKKYAETQRLNTIGIVTDHDEILGMTIAQLKDQFRNHKNIQKDKFLAKVTQSSIKTKSEWQSTIIAAATRLFVEPLLSSA